MGSSEPLIAFRVAKQYGEVARSRVRDHGLLDPRRKVVAVEGYLEIPLKAAVDLGDIGELVTQEVPVWYRSDPRPYELIQEKTDVTDELKALLPRRWERIGDVLLVNLPMELRPHSDEVCKAYAGILGVKSILDVRGGIEGPWRLPRLELLWGNDTVTVHKENGVRFKLDVREVMFSSGNVDERIRMSKVCAAGEVVVDLFAGIGYFALPMAVHGGAERVYACEVNPAAYEYLVENVRINEVEVVVPLLGDCREVAPECVADRVVLGYLRETRLYLPKAVRCLRGEGWIHFHEACPDKAVSRLSAFLGEAARTEGKRVEKETLHRVKSYAPGVSHWVLDALIS